ncbi:MAG: hypothetical protein II891_00525 [Bacteroidales bacterium]|nr:hypothetical protein [Bacteroidales bacterium]
MKKISLALLALISMGVAASAQTMYDALDLAKDNYYGTARTMGMGNAVTAIGGDLGSIGLNPAGSAVAGYSTFTISQGLTISSTNSSWAPAYSTYDGEQQFSGSTHASRLVYTMPNIGFNLRLETGNLTGVKSWNFAFLSQMTNNFLDKSFARGFNSVDGTSFTSMAGSLATGAMFNSDGAGSMLDPDILTYSDPYNTSNAAGNYDRWRYIVAYQGGMINYNETPATGGAFYGANEYKDGPYNYTDDDGNPYQAYKFGVPGRLIQTSQRYAKGSKNDIITNMGFNVNDNFYFGFNLNIPLISIRRIDQFSEAPDASWPTYGTITPEMVTKDGVYSIGSEQYFRLAEYEYGYDADITGISAGAGFIWQPIRNLRIGASIKTPTSYGVEERYYMTVDTQYDNISRHGETPIAEGSYNFRAPWSWNAGLAWTFGSLGLVSADYQMTDFSVMRYSPSEPEDFGPDNDPFALVNEYMNLFCGVSHTLRLGAEFRVLPFLAVRAGYTFTSNPERYYYDNEGFLVDAFLYERDYNYYKAGHAYLLDKKYYVNAPVNTLSCGVGFVSTGSFYADFAVRGTRSASYFSPYDTYLEATDATGNVIVDSNNEVCMIVAPCTRSVRTLIDAIVTIGWRF